MDKERKFTLTKLESFSQIKKGDYIPNRGKVSEIQNHYLTYEEGVELIGNTTLRDDKLPHMLILRKNNSQGASQIEILAGEDIYFTLIQPGSEIDLRAYLQHILETNIIK
jgi:hypothetical protein